MTIAVASIEPLTVHVRVERLEIRLLRLPLVRHFETSFGRSYDRLFLLVRVDGGGQTGWGECVAEHNPYYSSETTETAWHIISEFIAPLVVGVDFAHPRDIFPALARVRGHFMAKGVVEMAAWDLFARQQQQPLWQVLGGSGQPVASGVSIGIQDSLDELVERVAIERDAGYQRIKIKIKPGWDVDAVRAHPRQVRADPADGRCQRRLHAGRRRAPGAAGRVRPDDDRAAARLRRHRRPCRACSAG